MAVYNERQYLSLNFSKNRALCGIMAIYVPL